MSRAGVEWPELSVVVPAFNEELRLPDLLAAMDTTLDPLTTEVIVVDDGSSDHTSDVAREALRGMPMARISRLPQNLGKGGAVRAGVLASRGRIVAYMDADHATDLSSLGGLVDGLADADVSIGSRAHDASTVERARVDRTILGRSFNRFIRTLSNFDHLDTQCGFKAFHRPVAKLLFSMSHVNGFAFDVEILHLAHKLGLNVVEVPVHWQHIDGSKIHPLTDSFRMAADTLRLTNRRPSLTMTGLQLDNAPRSAVVSALLELDERRLVSWNTESIEVFFTPSEPADESGMAEHFSRWRITSTPIARDCREFLGPKRRRSLSLGLPVGNGSRLRNGSRAKSAANAGADL